MTPSPVPIIHFKLPKNSAMKLTNLLIAIAVLPVVSACTTVREDPRSVSAGRSSLYQNTDTVSGGGVAGGGGTSRRTTVTVSEPQPTPIRVKSGAQPTQYLNTTTTGAAVSPYDRPGSASPLRHDTPDQSLYKRQ